MIVAIINQKGGAGKTTLALNLAAQLSRRQLKILVVDADPQQTASDWATVRNQEMMFQMVSMTRPVLHRDLPAIARKYDHTIIDGAPRNYEVARSAVGAADHIIIPLQPSGADFWATRETVRLVHESQAIKPGQKAALVISRRVGRSVLGNTIMTALGDFKLPVLAAHTSQRVAYAEAMTRGLAVCEYQPAGAAAEEISRLAQEIVP